MKPINDSRSTRRILFYLLAIAVLTIVAWKLLPVDTWMRSLILTMSGLGVWGMLAYYVVFVLAACIGFPRTPLTIGAGILFSYTGGLATVLAASATTFFLTFEISRHYLRDSIKRELESSPNAATLLATVEEQGFKMVFLLRMNPFIPGVIKGYALGTTSLRLSTYMFASILGFLPLAAAYTYLGWLGGVAMMNNEDQPEGLRNTILIGGAIVSTVLIAVLYWYSNRLTKRRTATSG